MLRPFAHLLTGLMTLAAILLGLCGPAAAQSINNQAQLELRLGGELRTITSNLVTARAVGAPTPATITFFRASTQGQPLATSGGQCLGSGGAVALPEAAPGGQPATVAEAGVYRAGDLITVSLKDLNRNTDSGVREEIELTVLTDTGDEERLRLRETSADSGIFAGNIQSVAIPPSPTRFDCQLSVRPGVVLTVRYTDAFYPQDQVVARAVVDPVEFVFDSATGQPLNGARITLIDMATGQPALVFGDDGRSSFPATVVSGGQVTDSSGTTYQFPTGGFRFPVVAAGSYRFAVVPPEGYRGPSQIAVAELARLLNPAGDPYTIDPQGSLLKVFTVNGPLLFRIDIPLDRQEAPLVVRKSASVIEASAGDHIQYRVSVENRNARDAVAATALIDTMASGLRYRAGSLRIGGVRAPDPAIDGDGTGLRIALGTVPAGRTIDVTYVVQVTAATREGEAVNRVHALAGNARVSNEARVAVRIRPLLMSDAATIIGRVFDGGCDVALKDNGKPGLPGVRVLLDDGSFVISDKDGLFHFEGVRPGVRVVQLDLASLPDGFEAVQCLRSTRSAGRAFSQFVDVRGGALWRTDFHVRRTAGTSAAPVGKAVDNLAKPVEAEDEASLAAGARTDWFAGQTTGNAFLFPGTDHNPRAPSVRAVIKHLPGTSVRLTINGTPAGPLTLDGTSDNPERTLQVSKWRGLQLAEGANRLVAEVIGSDGKLLQRLETTVTYANSVAHAELVPARSKLIADGRSRPVIAIRLTDRNGQPVRRGVSGTFALSAPYRPASDLDLQQAQQLVGSARTQPVYQVTGDDGIALIELAPTTQAGSFELTFAHELNGRRITETARGWMQPGDQPWVVVGFAAGTVGHDVLTDQIRRLERPDTRKNFRDGQVSFFAKGRILGKWLLTLAYDSDKETGRDARRPLGGVIDPQRYYDVYADGTEQGYDAATTRKLYLRLERAHFVALFGDYETGLTDSRLARYNRSLTGGKAEYRRGALAVKAFAAETAFRFARDEIQGSGLSGPYRLSRSDIILNSDKVRIEVRDRFRSERIVDTRTLLRHVDYDIDYDAATLRFRSPVTSRDADFNPQFIVVDYETEGDGTKALNAGGRAALILLGGKVEAGVSAIHEEELSATTNLVGADARIRLGSATEVRLEGAGSRTKAGGETREGTAVLAEVEHRGRNLNALAYYRQQDEDFGVGQLSQAENGTRKYGADAQLRVTQSINLTGSAWHEDQLATGASRDAARALAEFHTGSTSLRAGVQFARDQVPSGETLQSSQLVLGASQALVGGRLRLDGEASVGLGSSESLDFPNRYRVGASYALRPDVRLLAAHEITKGKFVDTATTSVGIEASPWQGARLTSGVNNQAMGENGSRTYALYGLAQRFALSQRWSIDASLDGSRTLKGAITADRIVNPAQPVASGGYLDAGRTLSDDFTALSLGASYRGPTLSWNARGEIRDGELDRRIGITTALLRQTKSGISFAASASFDRAAQAGGTTATLAVANAALAWRPLGSSWAILDKLELRWDELKNGRGTTDGLLGANALGVVGDARSRRIVNNLAVNLVGDTDGGDKGYERSQLSFYYGSKYVLDRFDRDDFAGYTHMLGAEGRFDLSSRVDLGVAAAVRHNLSTGTVNWLVGPSVGVSPMTNLWVSFGYNVTGFNDRDFDDARYTRAGAYLRLRFKFDQDTPAGLFGRASRKSQ